MQSRRYGFTEQKSNRLGYVSLVVIAICVALISLALSENYIDYDSITRSLMGYNWYQHPFLITAANPVSSVFGPLQCYLGAIPAALGIHPDLGLRLVSYAFSIVTLVYAGKLAGLLFGERAGLFAMVFIMLYSLWIRGAAIANSEAIAGALFIGGLYYLCLWLREQEIRHAFVAGALFAFLTATRYEFWLLIPPTILYALFLKRATLRKSALSAVVLVGVSGLFAVFWLAGNYYDSGDPLKFIHGAGIIRLNKQMIEHAIAERGFLGNLIYNLLFLPGVTILSLGALATGAVVFLRRRHFEKSSTRLLLLVVVVYVVYHIITFVYPAKTVNLARYTYAFGLLVAILGSGGLLALQEKVSARVFKITFTTGILLMLGQNIIYAQFATPGADPMTERLRALSPISKMPQDVTDAVSFARKWLAEGEELTIDYRYSPERLLYLKLYEWKDRITTKWPESFAETAQVDTSSNMLYLLHQKSPYQRDKLSWTSTGEVMIAGVRFEKVFTAGDYVFIRP